MMIIALVAAFAYIAIKFSPKRNIRNRENDDDRSWQDTTTIMWNRGILMWMVLKE